LRFRRGAACISLELRWRSSVIASDYEFITLEWRKPGRRIILVPMNGKKTRCGIAALAGPPNVGKSTLLNRLLGQKISIVSPKPQTTRNRIAGIITGEDHQIVILDTPGIHEARSPLNREMVRVAAESLADVDIVVFMTDVTIAPEAKSQEKTAALVKKESRRPSLLVINKIDLVKKEELLPLIDRLGRVHRFEAIIPISAKNGDGVDIFLDEVAKRLPEGPMLYPPDIPTDASERFIVSEIIREKVFLKTSQEIPYSTAVTIDAFNEERGRTTIHASIVIERKSQKGIIIGKGGARLKEIGSAARREIESLLGQKVVLKLWVKVKKDWSRDPGFMRELGF